MALAGEDRLNVDTGDILPVGNTVDANSGTYTNDIGASQLQAVWEDPEFDPKVAAVYYARVLQIPTPRWTTVLAARANLKPRSSANHWIQERGWSSPIWFTPD